MPTVGIDSFMPVVLVEYPTGIHYTDQVGGIACLHPAVEGFLYASQWLGVFDALDTCFGQPHFGEPFTDHDADALERAWPKPSEHIDIWLWLDRGRLDQGTEAWVPVWFEKLRPVPDLDDELDFLHEKRGFLVLQNCD